MFREVSITEFFETTTENTQAFAISTSSFQSQCKHMSFKISATNTAILKKVPNINIKSNQMNLFQKRRTRK